MNEQEVPLGDGDPALVPPLPDNENFPLRPRGHLDDVRRNDGSDDHAREVDIVGDERDEENLSSNTGPNDPARMQLTTEEPQWALDIKYVIENLPELDNLSDFWYAQLAIVCKDNVEDAVQRAVGLQSFRQEYNILETLHDGQRRLSDYVRLLPQYLLAFSFSHQDDSYVVVLDWNKANFSSLSSVEKVNSFFAGAYYLHHALQPDIASIRNGCIALAECEGVEWSKKLDFKLLHKLASQMASFYPYKPVVKHFHTGLVMNVLLSLTRQFLPGEFKEKLQTGFSCHARLDTLFLVPTAEAAMERMLCRMHESLKRRFEKSNAFSLLPE